MLSQRHKNITKAYQKAAIASAQHILQAYNHHLHIPQGQMSTDPVELGKLCYGLHQAIEKFKTDPEIDDPEVSFRVDGFITTHLKNNELYYFALGLGNADAIHHAIDQLPDQAINPCMHTIQGLYYLIDEDAKGLFSNSNISHLRFMLLHLETMISQKDKFKITSEQLNHAKLFLALAYENFSRGTFATTIPQETVHRIAIIFSQENTDDALAEFAFLQILFFNEGNEKTIKFVRDQLKNLKPATKKQLAETKEAKEKTETKEIIAEKPQTNLAALIICDHECRSILNNRFNMISSDLFVYFADAMRVKATMPEKYSKHLDKVFTQEDFLTSDNRKQYLQAINEPHPVKAANMFIQLAENLNLYKRPLSKLFAAHCYTMAGNQYIANSKNLSNAIDVYARAYQLIFSTEKIQEHSIDMKGNKINFVTRANRDHIIATIAKLHNDVLQLKNTDEAREKYAKQLIHMIGNEATDNNRNHLETLAPLCASIISSATEKYLFVNCLVLILTRRQNKDIKKIIADLLEKMLPAIDQSDSLYTQAHNCLGDFFSSIAEEKNAITHYEAAMKDEKPTSSLVTTLLRSAEKCAGDRKTAESLYDKVSSFNNLRGLIGKIKLRIKEYEADRAITLFEQCVSSIMELKDEKEKAEIASLAIAEIPEVYKLISKNDPHETLLQKAILDLFVIFKGPSIESKDVTPTFLDATPLTKVLEKLAISWLEDKACRLPKDDLNHLLRDMIKSPYKNDHGNLQKIRSHFIIGQRLYDDAIQCNLKIIATPGISLHDKILLLNSNDIPKDALKNSTQHQSIQDEISRIKDIEYLITLNKIAHDRYENKPIPQIYYDKIDAFILNHLKNRAATLNTFFENIFTLLDSKNVLARYAFNKLLTILKPNSTSLRIAGMRLALIRGVFEKEKGSSMPTISYEMMWQEISHLTKIRNSALFNKDPNYMEDSLFLTGLFENSINAYIDTTIISETKTSHPKKYIANAIICREHHYQVKNRVKNLPLDEKIEAFEFQAKDDNLLAINQLAKLYQEAGNHTKAAYHYLRVLILTSLIDPKSNAVIDERYQIATDKLSRISENARDFLVKHAKSHALEKEKTTLTSVQQLAEFSLSLIGRPVKEDVLIKDEKGIIFGDIRNSLVPNLLLETPSISTKALIAAALESEVFSNKNLQLQLQTDFLLPRSNIEWVKKINERALPYGTDAKGQKTFTPKKSTAEFKGTGSAITSGLGLLAAPVVSNDDVAFSTPQKSNRA